MKNACLVTGAAKRLGRVIALHLAGRGYDIALHYNHSREEAETTAGEIRALGACCEIFQADLSQPNDLAARVKALMPHCCALVNSAAIFERGPFAEANADAFNRHMAINFHAPVLLARAFMDDGLRMTDDKGSKASCHPSSVIPPIINILDAKITDPSSPYFYYMLSKRALAEFTRMAAAEGARMNAVCPGAVMESVDGRFGPDYAVAKPEQVAEAVHALLADETARGRFVFVDGKAS